MTLYPGMISDLCRRPLGRRIVQNGIIRGQLLRKRGFVLRNYAGRASQQQNGFKRHLNTGNRQDVKVRNEFRMLDIDEIIVFNTERLEADTKRHLEKNEIEKAVTNILANSHRNYKLTKVLYKIFGTEHKSCTDSVKMVLFWNHLVGRHIFKSDHVPEILQYATHPDQIKYLTQVSYNVIKLEKYSEFVHLLQSEVQDPKQRATLFMNIIKSVNRSPRAGSLVMELWNKVDPQMIGPSELSSVMRFLVRIDRFAAARHIYFQSDPSLQSEEQLSYLFAAAVKDKNVKALNRDIKKLSENRDVKYYELIAYALVFNKQYSAVHKIFRYIVSKGHKPTNYTMLALMIAYHDKKQYKEAMKCFWYIMNTMAVNQLGASKIRNIAYTFFLSSMRHLDPTFSAIKFLKNLTAVNMKTSVPSSPHKADLQIYTQVLQSSVYRGSLSEAKEVFKLAILNPNIVIDSIFASLFLQAYIKCGEPKHVKRVFSELVHELGVNPSKQMYTELLHAAVLLRDNRSVYQILPVMLKAKFYDKKILNLVLDFYVNNGKFVHAQRLIEYLHSTCGMAATSDHFLILMRGYHRYHDFRRIIQVFEKMLDFELNPEEKHYECLLDALIWKIQHRIGKNWETDSGTLIELYQAILEKRVVARLNGEILFKFVSYTARRIDLASATDMIVRFYKNNPHMSFRDALNYDRCLIVVANCNHNYNLAAQKFDDLIKKLKHAYVGNIVPNKFKTFVDPVIHYKFGSLSYSNELNKVSGLITSLEEQGHVLSNRSLNKAVLVLCRAFLTSKDTALLHDLLEITNKYLFGGTLIVHKAQRAYKKGLRRDKVPLRFIMELTTKAITVCFRESSGNLEWTKFMKLSRYIKDYGDRFANPRPMPKYDPELIMSEEDLEGYKRLKERVVADNRRRQFKNPLDRDHIVKRIDSVVNSW